jgi:hypothetical protein
VTSLPLAYGHLSATGLFQIIEADCQPSGLDPTGQLSSGHIRVAGHVAPAILEYRTGNSSDGIFYYTLRVIGETFSALSLLKMDYNVCLPGN